MKKLKELAIGGYPIISEILPVFNQRFIIFNVPIGHKWYGNI